MTNYDAYQTFELEVADEVARIRLFPIVAAPSSGAKPPDLHWELGEFFSTVRGNNDVRVVVIEGKGETFQIPPPVAMHRRGMTAELTDPDQAWTIFTGVIRFHQAIAQLEKPVIAKVNGDAIGFGQSIVFASDLIVADERSRFVDHHLGMGEVAGAERDWGIGPGDGGVALLPLFLSPVRAKEYLMLAREYTGRELERLGVINYAVPSADLDAKVDGLVAALLRRPRYALATTKRMANKLILHHLNMTLEGAAAYELIDFYQIEHARRAGTLG